MDGSTEQMGESTSRWVAALSTLEWAISVAAHTGEEGAEGTNFPLRDKQPTAVW